MELIKPLEVVYVSPDLLNPNSWNSNRVTPEMEKRLRASIKEFSFYKPIIVREVENEYGEIELQILCGEHRWRAALDMKMKLVPVLNLGPIDDVMAKTISLSDNAQFGADDNELLEQVLRDIGMDNIQLLPYDDQDLAGMFEAAAIDLDTLGIDDEEGDISNAKTLEEVVSSRPKQTHVLMRLKVPVEDQERVELMLRRIGQENGYAADGDSMVAAGMALVDLVVAAEKAKK